VMRNDDSRRCEGIRGIEGSKSLLEFEGQDWTLILTVRDLGCFSEVSIRTFGGMVAKSGREDLSGE